MWVYANPNPCRQEEPDCVVRAISIATGKTWDEVHWDLCRLSHVRCTMPSVNWLWEIYLRKHGFEKHLLPVNCPSCTTVGQFCKKFQKGTYVLATGSHAVCAKDSDYFDIWDSGGEVVAYYFKKGGQSNGI